ncbi:MAG: GntR family transcriptional regulator [Treponema sp.]|nr:GntR family transcriptional regulator [Treponema sp.]MCL2250551.1 GntR family transcriptional regulator [Treponema sp.]
MNSTTRNSKTDKPQSVVKELIHFSLDPLNGTPIYRQIIQQIEYAILSGRMKRGDKLPTIRSLAVDLKTNPNTIARAYSELEIRGILETQVGSGTYISDKKPVMEDDSLNKKKREVIGRFVQELRDLGVENKELIKLIESYIKETNL